MVYRVSKYVKIQVTVGLGNNNITFTATNTPFKIYDYISYENCYNKVYERLTQYFECFGVSDYCEANIVCELRSVETNSHILPMLSFQIAFNDNNGNILYYEPCVEGFVENHPWLPDGKRVASSYIGQSSFLTVNDSMTIKQMPEFIRRSEQDLEYEYFR